ncbi:MAG: right-handed parallel beta-helix repeat-containing protein [bacterium]
MKRDSIFRFILVFWLLFLFKVTIFNIPIIRAAEICVDINGNAPPDLNCYNKIQTAIDDAGTGDVIVVYQGTYKENIDFLGKAITVRSTEPDNSSVVSSTIIDGSQIGSVVTFNHGEVGSSVLNGLTIKNGRASTGGGIFCKSSSPTIVNCQIIYNSSTSFGGGIYCSSASPNIEKCNLYANSASFYGGGIYCYDSSPYIFRCEIGTESQGNSANSGGGIACAYYSSPIIENCYIQKNGGSNWGGGIYCSDSSPVFKKSVIRGNSSSSSSNGGGGIYCESSSLDMENCILSTNNSTKSSGGGLFVSDSSLSLKNCTLSRNSAKTSGGSIFCEDVSSLIIKNCIIWGNSPDEISGCTPTVSYSDIKAEDGTVHTGEGNINADPLFLYPEKENYYLLTDSPCIDAGTNTGAPETDINDKSRPLDGKGDSEYICDMGAYEFVPPQEYHVAPDGIDPMGTPCFESIQEAINATYNLDIIVVYPGVYKETINFSDKPITLRSTDPNDWDIVHATVIDGGQAARVICFDNGEGKYSVLQGLTLQNAKYYGIYCNYSSPSIEKCTIGKNNSSGIFSSWSSPNIKGCNLHNNNHGIYCDRSSPIIENCTIRNNNQNGIYCNFSSPTIKHCSINNNSNSGIYCNYSSPDIFQCTISLNSSQNGGGIYCNQNSSPNIKNCIINWNIASNGGGIHCINSSPEINHCTITENLAHSGGGIGCNDNSSPSITNSILWNNLPDEISGCTSAVSFSNIQIKEEEVYPGTGNINEDPLFADTKDGDFHLQSNSPCIDAGDPNSMLLEDLDAIQRPQDGDWNGESISDMGACEFWKKFCYRDSDMDGFGDPYDMEEAVDGICLDGYVENYLDCNDNNPDINPNALEIPGNYVDENCDGRILDPPAPISHPDPNIYVDPNGNAPAPCYETIQSAIDDADHGQVIIVMPGIYKENINFQGKAITLKGTDPNDPAIVSATIIDGNQVDRVITFNHGEGPYSVLKGLTIKNGKALNCGGIYCSHSSPSIEDCVITENASLLYGGGGIYCDTSSPVIKDCEIIKNSSASDGGGIYSFDSMLIIDNCSIKQNTSRFYGGGIFCTAGSIDIKNSLINSNSSLLGAGVYCRNSSLDITNCKITGNSVSSSGYGGGMCSHSSTVFFKSCLIETNSANNNGYGGGIYSAESSMMFENSTIKNNSGYYGGGIFYIGSRQNVASVFKSCSFTNNSASYSGGGIYCINARLNLEKCNIESNNAGNRFGGGIYCDSSLVNLSECKIRKNTANHYSMGTGGGIYCTNASTVSIGTSIISGNSATIGGGIYCIDASHSLENCIISTNSSKTNGGGIYCSNSSSNLSNCTMSRNSADTSGGGIFCNDDSSPVIKNCIIWGNSQDDISDCTPIVSYSDIFIEDGSVYPGIGNINQDPRFLYPEIENYYLLPFSPCIDTGDEEDAPDIDIAGKPRPLNGNGDGTALYDMGAYEFVPPEKYHVYPDESIQERIDEAYYFDIIIVSQGTYAENLDFKNKPITLMSEDPNDPNTINATVIDGGGIDNVVNFERGEREYSVLMGFTIQKPRVYGIYCKNSSSPRIENCIIKNSSDGIHCYTSSSPHVRNCYISNNSTGISCYNKSSPNIQDCSIMQNNSRGIYCNNSSPKIENCFIEDNRYEGIICTSYSSPYIHNCIISNNKNCGIYCTTTSSPSISNCQIKDNSGSGVYCSYSSPNITNSLILRNSSSYGGGIYCNRSSPTIIHCTVYDNSAFLGSGLYCENNSSPIIKGSIFWKNFPENEQISGTNCNVTVIYSDIQMMQGVYPGTGNINEDPLFRNPDEDDLHLQASSPCIEAGDPNCTITIDMDGEERPWDADRDGNAICDMGADEYKCVCYKDNDGDGYGDPNQFEEAIDCICSPGFVPNDQDSNDNDYNINPGVLEIPWNDKDDNCDGFIDTLPPLCRDSFLSFIRLVIGEEEYMISFGINEIIRREAPSLDDIPLSFRDQYNPIYYDYDVKDCQNYASYHWIVQIDPNMDPNSGPLLTWEPEKFPTREDFLWMLIQGENKEGNVLVNDMTGVGTYQVKPEDGNIYSIIWVPDAIVEDYISLQKGWNLISLPLNPADPNRQAIFPEAKAVWHFDPNLQKYAYIKENDHMVYGLGYWVLYPKNKTVHVRGSLLNEFSLDLKKGWNMIGALHKQTSILVIPGNISALYKFDQVYTLMENLEHPVFEPKMGYWILPGEESVLSASLFSSSTGISGDGESSVARLKEASSPEIRKASVFAIGQQKTDYTNIDKVTLGFSTTPKRALSPPPPPSTTISLSIIDHSYNASYAYDLRFIDSNSQTWTLWLQKTAVSDPDFYPSLTWEIPSSTDGIFELRKGDSESGEILVNDMKATGSYQLKEGDGELFTVLWRTKCVPEICDGIDNDCDGDVDEEDAIGCKTCYRDEDGDGYGLDGDTRCLCEPNGSGYSIQAGDCNDSDPDTHPGATELCDGKDNNCDGVITNDEITDADKDGVVACKDYDDNDVTVYPGAPEYCDGKDNDCDGEIDEVGATGCTTYHRDMDQDGYGVDGDIMCLCASEDLYTAILGGDCDDNDPLVYPKLVSVVSAEGYPGETDVMIPITINDAVGVAGGDIILTYDPNVLTALDIIIAPLIQDFLTDYYIIEAEGRVVIAIANSTDIESGSGTMVEIIFDVSEEAVIGTKVPLVLEKVILNGADSKPYCSLGINGEFRIVERGHKGDVNQDGEITSADVILTLKMSVGLIIPTDYQVWAADVNDDNAINAADAILILRAAVTRETIFYLAPDHGLPGETVKIIGWNFGGTQGDSMLYFGDTPANPISWRDHEIVTKVPLDIPEGTVDVYLINTYGYSSNLREFTVGTSNQRLKSLNARYRTAEDPKTVRIPAGIIATPCSQVNIPVETDDAEGIAGMDIELIFDPGVLSPVKVERTALTDGFLLIFKDSGDGRLTVSLANDSGIIEGSGALINVLFEVASAAKNSDSTGITISYINLYDEGANPLEETVSRDGQVLIKGEDSYEPEPIIEKPGKPSGIGSLPYYYPYYYSSAGYYYSPGNFSLQADWRNIFGTYVSGNSYNYPSGNPYNYPSWSVYNYLLGNDYNYHAGNGYNYPLGNGYNYPSVNQYNHTYQGSQYFLNPAFYRMQNNYEYNLLTDWDYQTVYPDVSRFILW